MRELLRQRLIRMSEKEISLIFSISTSEINAIKAVSLLSSIMVKAISTSEINAIKAVSLLSSIMVKTSSTLKDERYLS